MSNGDELLSVLVRDDGTIEFTLKDPILSAAPRIDKSRLTEIMRRVELTLETLGVTFGISPALSFRPIGDNFELYKLVVAIPGTTQLRQGKKTWPPRKRKRQDT